MIPPTDETETTEGTSLQVTQEQLDAVNARLDAVDEDAQRARNRRATEKAVGHVEPPPVFAGRTHSPEMMPAGIDKKLRADSIVEKLIGDASDRAKLVQEDLAWLTAQAKAFSEMTSGLLAPSNQARRLLASAFLSEQTTFVNKLKRVHASLDMLTKEIAHFEKQAVMHEELAMNTLRAPIPSHVASECRQWLRSLPDDQARHKVVYASIASGDREVLSSLVERGVPPAILGFSNRATFEQLLHQALRTFGKEHVQRGEVARKLKEKLEATRKYLNDSSDTVIKMAMLDDHAELKKMLAEMKAS